MKKLLLMTVVLMACVACFSSCVFINMIFPCKHKDVVTDAAVAATCTESGLTEGSHCAKCGEIIVKQNIVPALGHTEVVDEAVASTCNNTGLTEGKHCSVCGTVTLAQAVTPVAHDFGEWSVITEATCFFEGEKTRSCSICSTKENKNIETTEHSFVQDEESKLYSCELCDARIYAGHLYAAFETKLNWYDAYKMCSSLGGYLVTITSDREQKVITDLINSRTLPGGISDYFYWAGGFKNTDGYQWTTDEEMNYTNWGPQGLDGNNANWHIGLTTSLKKSGNSKNNVGDWEDLPHTDNCGFICEWKLDIGEDEHFFSEWEIITEADCYADGEKYRICTHCGIEETEVIPQLQHSISFNEATGLNSCEHCNAAIYDGRMYKIFNLQISWFDAYAYCESLGGHLVTITSAEEQTFIENYMSSLSFTSRAWIGLYNDGSAFKWITGEKYDYTNWNSGQPDCAEGKEFFAYLNYKTFGLWNDGVPNGVNQFICEWEAE